MDVYPTYESTKIKHPECDIYEHNCTPMGKLFTPGLMHSVMDGSYNNKCNPADHCMTVEKFLADGHKFVEGDLYLNLDGLVITYKAGVNNSADETGRNKNRYILRAAALETKEPKGATGYRKQGAYTEWFKGSKEKGWSLLESGAPSMDSIDTSLPVIPIENVRTKANYKKVKDSIFDLRPHLESGELYYKDVDDKFYEISGESQLVNCFDSNCAYRRIETPIEWWEDANDLLGYLANLSIDDDGILQLTMKKGQVGFGMSRDKWCDFARILLEQGE